MRSLLYLFYHWPRLRPNFILSMKIHWFIVSLIFIHWWDYHRGIYIELNSQVTKSSFKTKKAWVYNLTSLNREKSPTEREITYCINYISLALAAWGFLPHRFRPPQAWFYIIFYLGRAGRWVPVWYESGKMDTMITIQSDGIDLVTIRDPRTRSSLICFHNLNVIGV